MATRTLPKGSLPTLLLVAAWPAISAGVQGHSGLYIGPGVGVLEKIDSPFFSGMRYYFTPPVPYGYGYVPNYRVYRPPAYGPRLYGPRVYGPQPYAVQPNRYRPYYIPPQVPRRYYRRPQTAGTEPSTPTPAPQTPAGEEPPGDVAAPQQQTEVRLSPPPTVPTVSESPQTPNTTSSPQEPNVKAGQKPPSEPAPGGTEGVESDTTGAHKKNAPRRKSRRYR